MYDLIIRDATIIRPEGRLVADIAIEEGRVAYIGGNTGGGAHEEVAGIGRFVVPGLIDPSVRFRRAGATEIVEWAAASQAAAISGVTTVLDLPGPAPIADDRAALRARAAVAAATSLVCHGHWIAAHDQNVDEALAAVEEGLAVGAVAHMDGEEGPWSTGPETLRVLVERCTRVLGVHAEDPAALAKARRKWAAVVDPIHNDVRPPKAAVEALKTLIALVKETGRPVHLLSLSTAGELNLLDPIRGDIPLTSQVMPSHLFLSVETSGALKDLIKVDPPIRGELDRRALWAAIKRGRIDMFASGHLPLMEEQKQVPYWEVPGGIPGVEMLFPLLMNAVKHGRLGLERMVEMCCEAPARIFGLEGKGHLQEGADADLILFAEGDTQKLKRPLDHSDSGWTPYVGREVGLMPQLVMIAGKVVARSGVLEPGVVPAPAVRLAALG